jgi:hypothetical protein
MSAAGARPPPRAGRDRRAEASADPPGGVELRARAGAPSARHPSHPGRDRCEQADRAKRGQRGRGRRRTLPPILPALAKGRRDRSNGTLQALERGAARPALESSAASRWSCTRPSSPRAIPPRAERRSFGRRQRPLRVHTRHVRQGLAEDLPQVSGEEGPGRRRQGRPGHMGDHVDRPAHVAVPRPARLP